MSKIGAHISVAGGIDKAPERAHAVACETFQCFTRPPQGGPAPKLTDEIIGSFRANMLTYGFESFYIHTPYILNFASLSNKTRHGSISIVREELERGSLLGARYVMTHVGSHKDQTQEEGIEKVSKGLSEVLDGYTGSAKLLIEISAGAGNILGDTFEEVAAIMAGIKKHEGFGGICYDTCHGFASGYDVRSKGALKKTLEEFDRNIGIQWLKLTHANDSKFDFNQKKDRHEHIGQGYLGEEGMRNILTSEPFLKIDWILETEPDGRDRDIEILKKFRDHVS